MPPPDFASGVFQFLDNTGVQYESFQNGQLVFSSSGAGNCWTGATTTLPSPANTQCPIAHRALPANLATSTNWFVEGYAYLDNSINPTQCNTMSGIAICACDASIMES